MSKDGAYGIEVQSTEENIGGKKTKSKLTDRHKWCYIHVDIGS